MMKGKALEIEPDGIPNKLNRPLSTTQFNVWYHLGLAHYLKGEYPEAVQAYQQCMEVSDNDDLLCATTDWLYMTLMRLGQHTAATDILSAIHSDMEIIENDAYHKRLLMYKGEIDPKEVLLVGDDDADKDLALATQGYGVGNWYLTQGDTAAGIRTFESVVSGKHTSAFGYIAAEADLKRLK